MQQQIDMSKLEGILLREGAHSSPAAGMCVMEAAAFIAGEPFSDHPACVSGVIGEFLRSWNDGLPSDAERTRLLLPLIPKILGSAASPPRLGAHRYAHPGCRNRIRGGDRLTR